MRFEVGDIVRYHEGKTDWEIKHVISTSDRKDAAFHYYYILESGMSGRTYTAWPNEVRKWVPGER